MIPSSSPTAPPTAVVWDTTLLGYKFTDDHPMSPVRLELTERLTRDLGVLDAPNVTLTSPEVADDQALAAVHEPAYIAAVRAASEHGTTSEAHGLGTEDNPVFADMHHSAARIADGTLQLAEALRTGQAVRGVNFAGGMHHAARSQASGFCIYNDAALAIARLLEAGAERVAYVDLDVHHGDGVQAAFFDDPRVLTISVHEHPRVLFPGTGWAEETGGAGAEGSAVNVAVPPGTGDEGWLRAIHAVVPELLQDFAPQVLVSQHGADTHFEDPLAHLAVSVDAQRVSAESAHRWAHDYAEGRWVALGGGGYAVTDVVPRTWTHLVGVAAGAPVPPETEVPEDWRQIVYARTGSVLAPRRMTDGREPVWRDWHESGYDPADRLDQAVRATRNAVFPAHGLLP